MIFIGVIAIILFGGTSNKDRTVNASNHNEKYLQMHHIDETFIRSIAEVYDRKSILQ